MSGTELKEVAEVIQTGMGTQEKEALGKPIVAIVDGVNAQYDEVDDPYTTYLVDVISQSCVVQVQTHASILNGDVENGQPDLIILRFWDDEQSPKLVSNLRSKWDGVQIIFVDNQFGDRTERLARQKGAQKLQIPVLDAPLAKSTVKSQILSLLSTNQLEANS